jgi:hypothetical protein
VRVWEGSSAGALALEFPSNVTAKPNIKIPHPFVIVDAPTFNSIDFGRMRGIGNTLVRYFLFMFGVWPLEHTVDTQSHTCMNISSHVNINTLPNAHC